METIASQVQEKKLFGNGRVFVARTGARDIVSLEGSVIGGSDMLPRAELAVLAIASRLFDAGTKKHSKDELRESLAARGISLSFSSDGERTLFSGSCLPDDLQFLLSMIAECLSSATFAEKEISSIRERMLGELKEGKTDTRTQAAAEFARLLYDPSHVNYAEKDTFIEKSLRSVTRTKLTGARDRLGTNGLVLAIVGDIAPVTALKAVERAFASLDSGTFELKAVAKNTKVPTASQSLLSIPAKTNIDLFIGATVPLTYEDPLYLPFFLTLNMLGGGFAGHLMQTVRERDGLTYGIRAMPYGFNRKAEGAFRIWATFSPDLYEKGLSAIRKELKTFFSKGLTEEMLQKTRDELTGSYALALSTTHGFADRLHFLGTHDKPLSYLDEYLVRVNAVSVEDIQKAAALVPLNKLSLAAAGTFAK